VTARVVHFVLHVPKCAGTTVEAHFERHLGPGYLHAPRWESLARNLIGNRYTLSAAELAPVRVVSGHSLSVSLMRHLPGVEIRESVLLRDPLGYLLSFYNYRWTRYREGWGVEPPSFETWYRGQRRNPISRFLLNRYFEQGVPALYRLSSAGRLGFLEARLERFHFVGGYRRAGEMIAGISAELGIPGVVEDRNVTGEAALRPADLPERLRERIDRENALDAALYARWKDRGWRAGAAAPGSLPALARLDQPRYVLGDATSAMVKKLIR